MLIVRDVSKCCIPVINKDLTSIEFLMIYDFALRRFPVQRELEILLLIIG